MGLPWRRISVASLATAYLAASRQAAWSRTLFLCSFAGAWVLQSLAWVIWRVVLYPKLFSRLRHLPSPAGSSFFNGHYAKIAAEPSGMPMQEWANSVPNDGVIRYLGLLNAERLLVTSPKALAEVLVTRNYEFPKPGQLRHAIGRILGVGVLLAEGDEHRFQRKNLMPAFAFRHIKDLYPLFWDKARECVEAMTGQILLDAAKEPVPSDAEKGGAAGKKGTAVIEVGNWASRATLDIIGVAGMGRDFGAIKDPSNPLTETYNSLFKPNKQAQLLGLVSIFVPAWIVSRLPVKRNNDIHSASRMIRATCRDLIHEKKAKMARKEPSDPDILSVALESGAFTDENLVDQLMTFLAAGHETTASATTWAIYLLCLHPEVQTRLRDEVRSRLPSAGDAGKTISSVDVDRMPYLNAVCSEVLRYYGPVPVTFREAAVDTQIQGHFVPKGTRIMLAPWATNKSLDLWGPDATVFNPDRWLAKSEGDKSAASGGATSNYAFMTFLHGPRSCIGNMFAKAELACLVAAWVGRFEFRLQNELEMDEKKMEIKGGITARPAKGLHVYATVLDGW